MSADMEPYSVRIRKFFERHPGAMQVGGLTWKTHTALSVKMYSSV